MKEKKNQTFKTPWGVFLFITHSAAPISSEKAKRDGKYKRAVP